MTASSSTFAESRLETSQSELLELPEPGSDRLVLSSFSRMMATRDPHQPMEKGGSIEIETLLEFKALKKLLFRQFLSRDSTE